LTLDLAYHTFDELIRLFRQADQD